MNSIGNSKAQKHSMVTDLRTEITNVVKAIITDKDHQILRSKELAARGSWVFKISPVFKKSPWATAE